MEIKEFDRADMAREIANRTGHDFDVVMDCLKTFPSVLADALVQYGGRVEMKDIGTYRLQYRAARSGHVPGTNNEWHTPERQSIEFEAAPFVANIVTERTGIPTY